MSRRSALLAALLVAVLALGPGARLASAQDDGVDGVTDRGVELPDPHIIPRPGEGHAPEDAGDRGGALQLLVLGVMVVVVGGGIALVVRESRRARRT